MKVKLRGVIKMKKREENERKEEKRFHKSAWRADQME